MKWLMSLGALYPRPRTLTVHDTWHPVNSTLTQAQGMNDTAMAVFHDQALVKQKSRQ
jgi:hypothetical protein